MRSTSHSSRKARPAFACTLAAACLTSASTSASAADPGLPNLPQVSKLPNVQPPSVQLPAPPSAPQVPVPRTPALPVPAPSLPGTSGGGGGAGRAAPGAGALPGQGTGGSAPYSSGGAATANGTAAAGADPAARRRRANRRLQRSVRNLHGCLSAIDGLDRRVLVLRTGLGGRPAGSRQSVARRLDVSQRRVARAERTGLKGLRGAARSSSCESGPSPMAVSRTPWLMPLSSASTGLLLMASLAGDLRAEERSDGAVLGVTRSGPEDALADGAESPGSLVTGDEGKPKRVTASAGDGTDLLLALLLTLALLALLAAFVVLRNRRSASIAGDSAPPSEARAAPAPKAAAAGSAAPWAVEERSKENEAAPPKPEPVPEPAPAAVDPDPAPQVEDEVQPKPAAPTPVPTERPANGSHRARNVRLAAALAASGVIRALLRVRRRR